MGGAGGGGGEGGGEGAGEAEAEAERASATITVRARGFGSRCVRSVWLGFRTRPPLPLSPHLVDGLRGVLVDGTHPCRDVLERRLVSHIVHLRGGGLGLGLGLG